MTHLLYPEPVLHKIPGGSEISSSAIAYSNKYEQK